MEVQPVLQVYVCLLSAVQVDSSVAPPVAKAVEALVTEALGAPLAQLLQVSFQVYAAQSGCKDACTTCRVLAVLWLSTLQRWLQVSEL
jgi:hypothetical protein